MTVMVVMLTVIVNGMTMASLMRVLGLTATPDSRRFAVSKAMGMVQDKTDKFLAELQRNGDHASADWPAVRAVLLTRGEVAKEVGEADQEYEGRDAWLHVLQMKRALYLELYEKGSLNSSAYNALEKVMADMLVRGHALSPHRQWAALLLSYRSPRAPLHIRPGKGRGLGGGSQPFDAQLELGTDDLEGVQQALQARRGGLHAWSGAPAPPRRGQARGRPMRSAHAPDRALRPPHHAARSSRPSRTSRTPSRGCVRRAPPHGGTGS